MRGHFHTPPPTFIGGRQPYAPRLGQVQSGPTPDNPPPSSRAVLGVILSSWIPGAYAIPQSLKIAPFIPAPLASNPPTPAIANLPIILGQWNVEPTTVISLTSIAPFATAPTIDNPPPISRANLNAIVNQWYTPPRPVPMGARIAPLIQIAATADSPPPRSVVQLGAILGQWQPPVYDLPKAGRVASILAPTITPDNPPRTRTQWQIWKGWEFPPEPKQPRHLQKISFSDTDVIVPYLIGDELTAALARIASIYCVPLVIGTTGTVTAQDPPHMTVVPRGTTITITLGGAYNFSRRGKRRGQPPYGVPDKP